MRRMGFGALALAITCAMACNERAVDRDGSAVGTSGAADAVSSADKDFVHDLSLAGMAEVELGKLALEHSANAEVKKFGQMMIDDHTQAGAKLKAIASEHNIPVAVELDEKHRDLRENLAKLQGAEFDRAYMDAMVEGHESVLDKVESRVDNANVAGWRTELADRIAGKKVEDHDKLPAVVAETSDNPITMSINQWAAGAYPRVHTHLETAQALDDAVEKRGPRRTQ